MTDHEWLQIITLATPVAVLLMALLMVRLTRWQDERDGRRRVLHRPPLDSTVG